MLQCVVAARKPAPSGSSHGRSYQVGSRSRCAIIRILGIGSWKTVHGADVKPSSYCRSTTNAILGGKPRAAIAIAVEEASGEVSDNVIQCGNDVQVE